MKYQTYLQNLRRSARVTPGREVMILDDDCDLCLGFLVDLSLRGMRLCGTRPIPMKRTLNLRIEVTTPENGPSVILPGTCVWCNGVAGTEEYESGIAFDLVTGATREALKSLIAAISS